MSPGDGPLRYAESEWERSTARPAIDEAFVHHHLGPWPELLDQPWTVLSGGLRSVHLRVGDVVARVDPQGSGSLRKEAALHRLVAADVRVPRVLDANESVLLMENVTHEELPASEQAGERVGRSAAAIHAHGFEHSGFFDENLEIAAPFASAYDGLRAWGEEQLANERLAPWRVRIDAVWKAAEQRLRETSQDPVLVHADFKPANVKWLAEEEDVVVFDWEFAWSGPALMDLGQMIRWDVPEAFTRGLERGYGNLPKDWKQLAELFDLFNMVTFVADGEGRPLRTRDAMARIEKTLRYWS